MKVKITEIEFDFFLDSDEQVSEDYRENLKNSFLGKVMEIEDGEDVSDVISDETGWCINHVDFAVV
jgi:hypothetical protein